MIKALRALRKKVVIGFVGGSDLAKITEQLSFEGSNGLFSPHRSLNIPLQSSQSYRRL